MKLTHLVFATAFTLVPAALFAQNAVSPQPVVPPATTPTTLPYPGATHNPVDATGKSIAERKDNQQDRIASGIQSGQLTAGESSHLEGQESAINKEESAMRAQDNGKLSKTDKETLTKQQNQESRRIRRDKHNTRVRK